MSVRLNNCFNQVMQKKKISKEIFFFFLKNAAHRGSHICSFTVKECLICDLHLLKKRQAFSNVACYMISVITWWKWGQVIQVAKPPEKSDSGGTTFFNYSSPFIFSFFLSCPFFFFLVWGGCGRLYHA